MKKINNVGLKLIEFKTELDKDYPELVQNSLLSSLEQMVENEVIDLDTYNIIKNSSEGKDDFISYILTNEKYVKSHEELFKEYEEIREELDEELKMHDLVDLSTDTVVEDDSIDVSKTFSIDRDFVSEYFGVGDEDIIKLMKRKGFIEKFAALRLVKILKDIIAKGKKSIEVINLDYSLAYFDINGDGYKIDFIMKVPVSKTSTLENKNKILAEIKEMKKLSEKMYKEKTIC